MKFVTTFEARNEFPRVLKKARKELIVVTNRGKPVAAIQGFASELDLEDYLLERSPKFWAEMDRARKGTPIPADEVWGELGIPRKKKSARR